LRANNAEAEIIGPRADANASDATIDCKTRSTVLNAASTCCIQGVKLSEARNAHAPVLPATAQQPHAVSAAAHVHGTHRTSVSTGAIADACTGQCVPDAHIAHERACNKQSVKTKEFARPFGLNLTPDAQTKRSLSLRE
jgi:hypothetical protein